MRSLRESLKAPKDGVGLGVTRSGKSRTAMNSDAKRRADEATSGREPASPTAPSPASQPSKWDRHRLGPLVALSQVSPERLHWISPGRLAAGKITIPDGDPGLGKSTLLCETVPPCARRRSRNRPRSPLCRPKARRRAHWQGAGRRRLPGLVVQCERRRTSRPP